MSSSVFVESSTLPADPSEYATTSDSNLVVVYGKNGISFDDKGLENLIEEKKISSISVIRLTSPTPSMEEEEEAEKLEEMLRRQEICSDDESLDSEDEDNNNSSENEKNDAAANSTNEDHDNEDNHSNKESDHENEENKLKTRKIPRRRGRQPNTAKQRKVLRRRKRERPEIVGLRLEEFYPPDDANKIIKEALKMAGLGSDKKEKEDFEFQLFVIKNDHCYTPFTSPTQMKAKLAADKLESEKQAANRKTSVLQPPTGKQLFVRKKPQTILQKTISLNKSSASTVTATKDKSVLNVKQIKSDSKDRKSLPDEDCVDDADDNVRDFMDESEDDSIGGEEESDFSGSDESAETDNDRDSDLDFDVNNPKGRKRNVKLLKTLKRSAGLNKTNSKSRRFYTHDETKPIELPNKSVASVTTTPSSTGTTNSTTAFITAPNTSVPSAIVPNTIVPNAPVANTPVVVQRQKTFVKLLSDPSRITVRSTPSKVVRIGGQIGFLSPAVAALPPIPKKQNENKSALNATTTTTLNMPHKTFVVKKSMDQKSAVFPSSSQTHKEIIINKHVMSSPKTKGFTDLNTLINQTEKTNPIKMFEPTTSKSAHTATITSVVTLTPASKVFMPIAMETAAKNQLPSQISIQTHQSSSELEAEHDKQLDLINSIVQNELKKSNEMVSEKIKTNINENIPELVKMLESTEKVLVSTKQPMTNVMHQNINQIVDKPTNNSGNQGNVNVINVPSTSTLSANNNTVGDIDIINASLLATPEHDGGGDDDLPDDILQQVVDLIQDDKTLQEAVEKQVFGTGDCNDAVVSSSLSGNNNIMVNQNPPPLAPISQPPVSNANRIQVYPQSTKSIIQMAISNVPTSSASTIKPINTTPTRNTTTSNASKTSPLIRKEPIQIIRGNGRVITLPPIEAPTTRAKRRAQAQPTVVTVVGSSGSVGASASTLSESSLDSSIHSNSSVSLTGSNTTTIQEVTNRRRGSKENILATTTAAAAVNQKTTRKSAAKKTTNKSQINKSQVEVEATESEEDDDDPNKLWCICRQPHNNRFMICCDVCEDWFHGTCVSITKAMGLEMEQKGVDWTCPKCVKKQEEKKQPKITEMLLKKPVTTTTVNQLELPTSTSLGLKPIVTSIVNVPVAPSTTFITTRTTDSSNQMTPLKAAITHQQMVETPKLKLQTGQIVNLKDLNISTKKTHIIHTSVAASTTPPTAAQKKMFVTTNQPLKLTTQQGAPIRTITVVKQIATPQQQQHQNIKVIKTISPAQSTTQTAVAKKDAPTTLCIVCKKVARTNSIYCSDDCIRKHAQNALNTFMAKQSQSETVAPSSPLNKTTPDDKMKKKSKGLFEDLLSLADRKPKIERVSVFERKSGRVLTGSTAPTISNLKKWLQDNPTFEVVQPGSTQAIELEKKQKLRTQHSSSPTIIKSATSPPPLKMFPLASNATHKSDANLSSPQTQGHHSPHVQSKAKNKSIADFMTSPSTSSSPRPSTPKQLQSYPQQVSIKPDRNAKTSEETKTTPKEKTSSTKRQTSTESSSKSGGSNDGEPIRLTIRRTLKEQLLLRYKEEISNVDNETETKDTDVPKPVNEIPKLADEELEEFAKETEQEMYNYFNRDTGIKYKAKYRSLVFNIKDRKNQTLFAKICAKLIEPKQLVRMSPEEMASQELAQWREKEAKHQLEIIKKSELDLISCAKNYVLKTHKGEEVIEGKSSDYANVDLTIPVEDVVSALNKSDLLETGTATTRKESFMTHWSDADSTFLSHSVLTESHSLQEEDKMKTPSAAVQNKDKDKDREKDKNRDRDRDRERERDRDRDKHHKSKDRHRDKSRSRKRSRSHSRSRSRDRGEKRHKSGHRDEKREREDRGREKEHHKDSRSSREHHHYGDGNDKKQLIEKKLTTSSKLASKQKQQEQQRAAINPMDTYNLIDQILESTKTVEEAANLVSERDKERDIENVRKISITPLPPVQAAAASSATTSTTITASSNDQSTPVVDIAADNDQEPTSTVSIPTPPHDPYSRFIACDSSTSPFASEGNHRYSISSLWTGNINMVDVTSFQLSLQPVVGTSTGLAKLLPKELDVVGRIGPETVWDYISKIKKSPNKEIVVLRLIPANETETSAYKILYEYLDNRSRLGVIKSISSQIKDFYIYPLGAGKTVPTQLQPSERVEFYDDPNRPDVLIGIIIRVVIVGGKRSNPNAPQNSMSLASTSSGLSKFTGRSNENDSFTPPGSPKPKKRRQSIAPKVDEIDVDAIIKAPIVAKTQKAVNTPAPLSKSNDADEPYSPGGSSDDDIPLLPVKLPSSVDTMQTAEDELKRKMEEINRQIAAQEMEIAGLLTGEPTSFGQSSSSSSKVLASISIPSNLSQILASIKTAGQDVVPPPPPLIGSLVKSSSQSAQNEEYNPADSVSSTHDSTKEETTSSNSSSRLAKLSEAELLSMVPDDIVITPNKPARHEEPPPPGV